MKKFNYKMDRPRPSKATVEATKNFEEVFQSYRQQVVWWKKGSNWMWLIGCGLFGLGLSLWLVQEEQKEVANSQPKVYQAIGATDSVASSLNQQEAGASVFSESNNVEPEVLTAQVFSESGEIEADQQVLPNIPLELTVTNGQLRISSEHATLSDKGFTIERFSDKAKLLEAGGDFLVATQDAQCFYIVREMAWLQDGPRAWKLEEKAQKKDQLLFKNREGEWVCYPNASKSIRDEWKPAPLNPDQPVFQLAFTPGDYPELSEFKNLKFQAAEGFEGEAMELKKYAWHCTSFVRESPGRYNATFKKLGQMRQVVLRPVLDQEALRRWEFRQDSLKAFPGQPDLVVETDTWILAESRFAPKVSWKPILFSSALAQSLEVAEAYWVMPQGILKIDPKAYVPYWKTKQFPVYVKTSQNQWLMAQPTEVILTPSGLLQAHCRPWSP